MANRIKELRLARGMMQRELAKKMFVSVRQIQNYENEGTLLPADRAKDFADFFRVTLDYLLCREATNDKQQLINEIKDLKNQSLITFNRKKVIVADDVIRLIERYIR